MVSEWWWFCWRPSLFPLLQVFPGTAHTHEAQMPTNITTEISIKPKEGAGAKLREELRKKL